MEASSLVVRSRGTATERLKARIDSEQVTHTSTIATAQPARSRRTKLNEATPEVGRAARFGRDRLVENSLRGADATEGLRPNMRPPDGAGCALPLQLMGVDVGSLVAL